MVDSGALNDADLSDISGLSEEQVNSPSVTIDSSLVNWLAAEPTLSGGSSTADDFPSSTRRMERGQGVTAVRLWKQANTGNLGARLAAIPSAHDTLQSATLSACLAAS